MKSFFIVFVALLSIALCASALSENAKVMKMMVPDHNVDGDHMVRNRDTINRRAPRLDAPINKREEEEEETYNKILAIAVDFSDVPGKWSLEDFHGLFFAENGSVKAYYDEVTYDTLHYEGEIVGAVVNSTTSETSYVSTNSTTDYDQVVYVRVPHTCEYYAANEYGGSSDENDPNAAYIVKDAVEILNNAKFNFAPYAKSNGEIPYIVVMNSGFSAAVTDNKTDIWPHAWYLSSGTGSAVDTWDGVLVDHYCIQADTSTESDGNVALTGIGTTVHEMGHTNGLPDLYDVSQGTSGLGSFDTMAAGSYIDNQHTPCHFSAPTKFLIDWIAPVEATLGTHQYVLRNVSQYPDALWIGEFGGSSTEATNGIVIEYRGAYGFDSKLVEQAGYSGFVAYQIYFDESTYVAYSWNTMQEFSGCDIASSHAPTRPYATIKELDQGYPKSLIGINADNTECPLSELLDRGSGTDVYMPGDSVPAEDVVPFDLRNWDGETMGIENISFIEGADGEMIVEVVLTCGPYGECDGVCKDTSADTSNCGGCGTVCGKDTPVCSAGECVATPVDDVSAAASVLRYAAALMVLAVCLGY